MIHRHVHYQDLVRITTQIKIYCLLHDQQIPLSYHSLMGAKTFAYNCPLKKQMLLEQHGLLAEFRALLNDEDSQCHFSATHLASQC